LLAGVAVSDTWAALVPQLNADQWRVLGVFACELKVTPSALERLGLGEWVPAWVARCAQQGLVRDAGVVHGLELTRLVTGERAWSIEPFYRPRVLRHCAAQGTFELLRKDALAVAGARSLSGFMLALYAGNLEKLQAELSELKRRQIRDENEHLVRSRLLEALTSPFDPVWLEQTWGEAAVLLVELVLSDALVALDGVESLYERTLARVDGQTRAPRLRILAEHALLRGDTETLAKLVTMMPEANQPAMRVAECCLRDALAEAQGIVDALGGKKPTDKRAVPCPASVTALLCLLALSRGQPDGVPLAKRLFQRFAVPEAPAVTTWPGLTAHVAVGHALRGLQKQLTEVQITRQRVSPHYLPADAPAWEVLMMALTVLVQDSDEITRASWAKRIHDDSVRWSAAGYAWVARQALLLSHTLNDKGLGESASVTPLHPRELSLAHLLEREPEWRSALRLLDTYVQNAERSETTLSRRVAWFVDMANGDLAKPAIEEYRVGSGWSRKQRVDLDELRSLKDSLPPEDAAILTAIDAAPRHRGAPLEAIEALIGHPRVFNGARARLAVEVIRGNCHIATHEDRGHLVIEVEPPGVGEGLNVVVESESRLVVYRVDATFAKLIQSLPHGVRIPLAHRNDGIAILARLAEHVEVRSPQLGACRTIKADSTPCLRISPETGAWWVEVGVRPYGEYGRFFPPGIGRPVVTMHGGDELFDTERSLSEEEARFHELLAQCPTLRDATYREREESRGDPVHGFSLNEEELFSLLAELRQASATFALEWKECRAIHSRGKVTSAAVQGSLRRVKGWYLVEGSVSIDQVTPLALSELVRLPFTKSGRFIRLPSGDFVEVEQRVRNVLSQLAHAAELPARGARGELRLPEGAFESIRALVDADTGLSIESEARQSLTRVEAIMASCAPLPDSLNAELRPYQLEGYQWLWRLSQLGLGACLADDMGLGKTVEVIALLLTRVAGGPTLVVAPTSVCSNWLEELRHFAPTMRATEYTSKTRSVLLESFKNGKGAQTDVVIVSYGLLQQDAIELCAIEWHTAVLDEGQFIKNPHSLRAKAAFQLKAHYRVVMTGTPIENHLADLWSILHFLNPTLLGSFKHFQITYLRPVERDQANEQQAVLKNLVRPFLLRRRKDEVLRDLPPVTTLRHEVRLTDDEAMRYAVLRRQINDKLRTTHGRRENKLQVLAEITRLRRFCCHPRLVFPDAPTESSKVQTFLELAEELHDNGHRALVFSQFVDFLDLVREQLDERRLRYLYLDGSTPKDVRQARVKEFQTGEVSLFLISLKAGGFGLNLTAADYVIHLDPWWNPAVEAQATDRAHRIGQEHPVTVYRLVTKDTIEERIMELHHEKRAMAEAILDNTASNADLSSDELLDLL
jgi:superfamily II DNA or RNA helicase